MDLMLSLHQTFVYLHETLYIVWAQRHLVIQRYRKFLLITFENFGVVLYNSFRHAESIRTQYSSVEFGHKI